jgi:hypothetical protein
MNANSDEALWDALADCGVPLSKTGDAVIRPSAEQLPHLLRSAARALGEGDGRKRECLAAFLLALATSYPSRYAKCSEGSPEVALLIAEPPTGRMLKLKRIAERRLSEIL